MLHPDLMKVSHESYTTNLVYSACVAYMHIFLYEKTKLFGEKKIAQEKFVVYRSALSQDVGL